MNIINYKNLAKNNLRRKAFLIAEAGYESINIVKTIKARCQISGVKGRKTLNIKGQDENVRLGLGDFKNIYLIGIGKGSALASLTMAKILGNHLTKGIALDVIETSSKIKNLKLEILTGDHPLPSKRNMIATAKIEEMARKAGADDLVITFICGGGSALACSSKDELTCSLAATKGLTAMGADIIELNTIRKHASEIKGGNLAKLAYPAMVVSLIISDVLGNDLEMIASGPTVCDTTTKKDAEKILRKYRLDPKLFNLMETPKDKKCFERVKNILFLSNKDAIRAMDKKAKELNFETKIKSFKIKGNARDVFARLGKNISSGEAILAAGETTVKLNGKWKMENGGGGRKSVKTFRQVPINAKDLAGKQGKGGRNTESVLGALNTKHLLLNTIFLSVASDGHDNSEAGGAIADVLTLGNAKKLGLNPQDYLEAHDSFNFFKKTADLIFVKKNSFNVADLMMVIKKK